MNKGKQMAIRCLLACFILASFTIPGWGQNSASKPVSNVHLLRWINELWITPPGKSELRARAPADIGAPIFPGTQLETRRRSRAELRVHLGREWIGANTLVRFIPSTNNPGSTMPFLERGTISMMSWERPGLKEIKTEAVLATTRGTELTVTVDDDGNTTITVVRGEVHLVNEAGELIVRGGEQAIARPGEKPRITAVLQARNAVQWHLYYAGILDPAELDWDGEPPAELRESLALYRAGNLPAAFAAYPTNRVAASAAETIYLAGLNLAFGQISEAEHLLDSVRDERSSQARTVAQSFGELVAAVNGEALDSLPEPETATAWLARSYYEQSRWRLDEALTAARRAVELSPEFGFAHARLAEMELSFGNREGAAAAVEQALALSPDNPQALAVRGFLHAARNRNSEAQRDFDRAVAIDPRLGNAWVGKGLIQYRERNDGAALESFLNAASAEPQRALLRAYLAKAFHEQNDAARARKEIEIAKAIDPGDPTGWLYSALLHAAENRLNEAIRELDHSQSLNDNRAVYRSRLLLDQDRAIRGANLARMYQEAGLQEVSLREGAHAVADDYANYSAHLFLAESYNFLRDARQFNLRYETPWFTEYLMANLLSPANAGIFSPQISQGEYFELFERNRISLRTGTEYLSNGDWTQSGVQFGTFGNTAYAVEGAYSESNGWRQNDDLRQTSFSVRLKHSLTPKDLLYLQAGYYKLRGGDLANYYAPEEANPGLRFEETQKPFVLAGYRREWQPGVQTLFLFGHVQDEYLLTDPSAPAIAFLRDDAGVITHYGQAQGLTPKTGPLAGLGYKLDSELTSAELQQIFQADRNTFILGARYQIGKIGSSDRLDQSTPFTWATSTDVLPRPVFQIPAGARSFDHDMHRLGIYAYDIWQPLESLQLTAGLAYEHQEYPGNFNSPPVEDVDQTGDRLSPKLGFRWTFATNTVVRAAWTRALGGVTFDQSFRLEPAQVSGFVQNFRNIISESVVGTVPGITSDTISFGIEQKIGRSFFAGVELQYIEAEAERSLGAFHFLVPQFEFLPFSIRENLDYRERSAAAYVYHLLGDYFSVGARYRLTESELRREWRDIPPDLLPFTPGTPSAMLHEVNLSARFNHPSRIFAGIDANYFNQSLGGANEAISGDSFWQFNAHVGYRFPRQFGELRLGILNLADQDYRLHPLNYSNALPRERTFFTSLILNL